MADVNVAIRYRPGREANPHVEDLSSSYADRDNADFLADVARRLGRASRLRASGGTAIPSDGIACIGLVGRSGRMGRELRSAQAVMRIDRTPSLWSHAFLLVDELPADAQAIRDQARSPWICESTFDPPAECRATWETFGACARRLSDHVEATGTKRGRTYSPNIALLAIGMSRAERKEVVERSAHPVADTLRFDACGLLAAWLPYLLDPARRVNPLAEGHAMPSAAYVQHAFDAIGLELAPGALQANICPEHIWQGVRRMPDAYRVAVDGEIAMRPRLVAGWYCIRDRFGHDTHHPDESHVRREEPSVRRTTGSKAGRGKSRREGDERPRARDVKGRRK